MKLRLISNALIVLASLLVICVLSPLPLGAQTFYGSVVGTVTDSQGAVVPGASATLTNIGTNETRTIKADAEGNYRFVNLVPANYKFVVEAAGFKRLTRDSITVQVESAVRIDAALQVGAANEVVEVTTRTPLLQTESASLGQAVEGQQVQEMPLNGRNVLNLIALTPGVVPQGSSMGTTEQNQAGRTSNQGWGNYQIGGGIAGYNAQYIDGAPNNILAANVIALVPTQDAIQEFRVDTNNISAEFGRFGGGVVNMTTKSGSNGLHGNVYEYFRNNVLNANNYFNNLAGAKRGKWNQNQYGANLTGPIVKDKAFYLFSWESLRDLIGSTSNVELPTQAMRGGLINKTLTFPSITPANCYSYPSSGTTQISPSCFDSAANEILNYWPIPTSTSNPNFFSIPVVGGVQNQYTGRADYNMSDKQRLFARYTYWRIDDIANNPLGSPNGFPTGGSLSDYRTHQAVLGDTYTLSPSTVLDVRLSYSRAYYNDLPPSAGSDITKLGGGYTTLASQVQVKLWPTVAFSGTYGLYGSAMGNKVDWYQTNTYAINASLTKIKGAHSIKVGGELRLSQNDATVWSGKSDPSGTFTFVNSQFAGDEWANFLLGYVGSGSIATANPVTSYDYSQGYFITDTWQATKRLTLNLGLRWELPGAVSEAKDRNTVLMPTTTDPVTGAYGTLALVNSTLYPSRGDASVRHDLFGPRVGFAYRLTDKMAVRGGYSISYTPPDMGGVMAHSSPVNSAVTNMYSSVNNANVVPANVLSNPFPTGFLQPVGRSNPNFMTSLLMQNISSPYPNQPYPSVQQRNLSVGYQLTQDLMVDIGYAGAKGTHLPFENVNYYTNNNLNELSNTYYSQGKALLAPSPGNSKISLGQSLRPHPAYLNFSDANANNTAMSYNGLQVKVEERLRHGGVLMGNYTWSKMIGNADSPYQNLEGKFATSGPASGGGGIFQDYNNLAGERSLLSFNVPNRAVVSYIVPLLFGKGQRFASGVSGAGDKLISGWTVNGITTLQSGFPLQLLSQANVLSKTFGAGQIRPYYTSSCPKAIGGSAQSRIATTTNPNATWFNTTCFSYPGDYAFGNESRVDPQLKADGIANYDFTVLKATSITERLNAQFRAEFFNIFNRAQFSTPDPMLSDKTFGHVISQANQPRLVQFSLRLNF